VTSDSQRVQFLLPFDDFQRPATPSTVEEYVAYMEATLAFIARRQDRMHDWVRGSGVAAPVT
jgi:hypothetical protein